MFGLSHLQAQLIAAGAGLAILIGVVVWLRADAADDRERDLRAKQNTDRLQHIEESKGTQNEVESLTDDDLDSALCRVLSTPEQCE
jgi:choline-glycine betaine transporter